MPAALTAIALLAALPWHVRCTSDGTGRATFAPADTSYYTLQDSLYAFRFALEQRDGTCTALFVDIRAKSGTGAPQHLVLDMVVPCPGEGEQLRAIEVRDFNFDGIADMRLQRPGGDPRLLAHRYWLNDTEAERYVPCPALDSLQHPNFHVERRMVGSQWIRRPGLRGTSTYHFNGVKLVMMANMEKYTEGDHERWVIWGMKDGLFQPVEERIMPLPQKH